MYNKLILFFAFAIVAIQCHSQECSFSIEGQVFDEASELPLPYVNVFLQELSTGTTSDEEGKFFLDSICAGHYHLIFSHIGCEAHKFHVDLESDTLFHIVLSHTETSLGDVIVSGKRDNFNNQSNTLVNRKDIEDNANENLSGLLENEAGVHLIQNGSGISKPVVHGLYGNRLTILNNGIIQSGQQWGNDHSPEIDPFASDKITVLKGASAIEYGGGNMGSVILVEPKRIDNEPHLHGQVNYAFESNGRGHNLNARLQKYTPFLAWRFSGSLKKYGDRKTPDYFLNNTGVEEANFSVQLEKSFNDRLFLDLYNSTFNTRLGVLRGSHIGNLTDLESALTRDVPFFTEPTFSYEIEAPYQLVSHHLTKIKGKYFISDNKIIEAVIAGQINNRKEFDVRRGALSTVPSLSLLQYSLNTEIKCTQFFDNNWQWKFGNQNILTDNTNNPETNILPLIPDYLTWKSGIFSTVSKQFNKTEFNIGLRYDIEIQDVVTIASTFPVEIIRYNNRFHNASGLLGIKHDLSKTQSISFNSGYAMRNPGINELYSNGLHQGVSGIETGNVDLKSEQAIKNTLEYRWAPNTNFTFSTLAYHQYFNDYIFLNPTGETRLTIRGAFPVFNYEQTDATIYGLDLSTQFTFNRSFYGLLKYSYLKGMDTTNDIPLIFMPPNSLYGSLTFRSKKPIKLSSHIQMEDAEIEINNRVVFEQSNLMENQDFVNPPPGYNLLGMEVSTNLILSNFMIRGFVKADNLFNVRYRDYLNRQRYFADDNGISITAGMNFKF